jgi:glycosyltransferase involved in cell wall biosynthesis
MRVAFLSHNAQSGDAVGNQLARKVCQFVARGWEVRVVVESDLRLHPAVRPYSQPVPVGRPTPEALHYIAQCDLMVIEFSQYLALLDWLPVMVGKRPRIVFDYHGVTPRRLWPDGPYEALTKGAAQRGLVWFADLAVVHSRYMRQELTRATRFPVRRIAVTPYAIDADWFTPSDRPGEFRVKLKLERAKVLTFVGRLAPNKRVPVLVEAVAKLVREGVDAHTLIAGDDRGPYGRERARCEELAGRLGVADRVHLLGRLSDHDLREVYRSGDVFVMPSRHEGFCVPVLEAAACGLPVVAAHATALPETVAGRGLTFRPDDAADLAAKVRQLLGGGVALSPSPPVREGRGGGERPRRIAVVVPRYGPDVIGGFETSVRTLAESLHAAGHHVEIHTTRMRAEDDWSNARRPGRETVNGVPVFRYDCDPADRQRYWAVDEAVARGYHCPAKGVREYLRNSVNSRALLDALRERKDELDAVIAGPYRAGLTWRAARVFADRLLLLPCFHDEPAARLRPYRERYNSVAGVLYHSDAEKRFAESRLGLTAPDGAVIGTWLDVSARPGDPRRGRRLAGADRYLLYCGRSAEGKRLRTLLGLAGRLPLPLVVIGPDRLGREAGKNVRCLGAVDEQAKRDLMAGAAALVQLSRCESLSLVTLEAWAQGTPVIGNARCRPVAENVRRSGGGQTVTCARGLLACVRNLTQNPDHWRAMGERGRAFVASRYGSQSDYLQRVLGAVDPVAGRGPAGSAPGLYPDVILTRLSRLRPRRLFESADVSLRSDGRAAVTNCGTAPLLPEGPYRAVLAVKSGRPSGAGARRATANLTNILVPGQTAIMTLPFDTGGASWVSLRPRIRGGSSAAEGNPTPPVIARSTPSQMKGVTVRFDSHARPAPFGHSAVARVGGPRRLAGLVRRMERLRSLPTTHADPAAGVVQAAKAKVKRLLLNSFQRLFAIPTNLQQSEFNRLTLRYLRHLTRLTARRR